MTDEEYAAIIAKVLGVGNIEEGVDPPDTYAEGASMPFKYTPNRLAGQDALRQEWETARPPITTEDILLMLLGRQGKQI